MMVITQKITSMAFEIHDGKTSVFSVGVYVCVCIFWEEEEQLAWSENASSVLLGAQKNHIVSETVSSV